MRMSKFVPFGTFYRLKGTKATAFNFSILNYYGTHLHSKLNDFTFNNVYLSIRISSSMHLVIFVAHSFHFIKTLKDFFLLAFYDYITMDWS